MFDYKVVVNKLNEVLSLIEEELPDNQIKFIRSDINSGEWNLALETLCEILNEEELPLQPKTYEILQEVGITLNTEPKFWEILKVQVTS